MASIKYATSDSRVTADLLSQFLPQPWVNIPFSNGWANHGGGSAAFSVRFLNAATAQILGALNPGTLAANTQFGTLPDPSFYPITPQTGNMRIVSGSNVGQIVPFVIQSVTGAIHLSGAALSGALEVVVEATYALDL